MKQLLAVDVNQLHLWRYDLNVDYAYLKDLISLLSPDELERASHFQFERDRNRFIAGRGVLRQILARYLTEEPGSISFDYGRFGKPALRSSSLQFNLSHSHDSAILAVTLSGSVGVDLEENTDRASADQIVKSQFSTDEIESYFKLDPPLRSEAYLRALSRKEACLKAYGLGLSVPIGEINVGFIPGDFKLHTPYGEPLYLYDLDFNRRLIGTVAVNEPKCISTFAWQPVHLPDDKSKCF